MKKAFRIIIFVLLIAVVGGAGFIGGRYSIQAPVLIVDEDVMELIQKQQLVIEIQQLLLRSYVQIIKVYEERLDTGNVTDWQRR